MKVMLLFPEWTNSYGIAGLFAKKASTWTPLNLAILGAIAESKGHDVQIIDGQAERIPMNKMIDRVLDYHPDVIGITGTSPFYHIATRLASGLKECCNTPILIGGSHITIMKENAFSSCFD